jgi:hypothetical protein
MESVLAHLTNPYEVVKTEPSWEGDGMMSIY